MGKTIHTTFKLALQINRETTCNIHANTNEAEKLKSNEVIIVDEISMTSRYSFEAIDRLLKDLYNNDKIFGDKIIIVSGDFRQTLPIIRHSNRTQIIENCIKSSDLWHHFESMTLKNNMRIKNNDQNLKKWLLNVGDGIFSNNYESDKEIIKIPEEMLSNGDLITEIFGKDINPNDPNYRKCIILAPTNANVLDLNNEIISRIKGESREYLSIDTAGDIDNENLDTILPIEFINSLTPVGLPPHVLNIKIGAVIILLRTINLNKGLCNGTRLIVKEMKEFTIMAEIISGSKSGEIVLLPRIDLSPSDEEIPFKMTRRQFPVRLGCAMTINKSQGQSFDKVGIHLSSPVFSHGQLYVALSRVTNKNNLKILVNDNAKENLLNLYKKNKKTNNENAIYIKIIVYKEILE